MLRTAILDSNKTKIKTYLKDINSSLTVHNIYSSSCPEYARLAFSRLRLISHNLKIETGRWARLPQDMRLCQCGSIQTEKHVILYCPLTIELRNSYDCSFDSIESFWNSDPLLTAKFIFNLFSIFK